MAELLPYAAPLIGGLLGSSGKQTTQTQQNTVDPRFAEYMYGQNGVLPSAQNWYSNNKTGLNSQMLTGMDNQWKQLGNSAQGFNQMQNLGMGLMGGGVASNPFTGGGGQAATQTAYNPVAMSTGANPFTAQYGQDQQTYQAQAAAQAAQRAAAEQERLRLLALQNQYSGYYGGGADTGGNVGSVGDVSAPGDSA
jgi:hypothetical protein